MSDEATLLSCPFCGGEARPVKQIDGRYAIARYSVSCDGCSIVAFYEATEAEAIAAWNTRATHGTLTAELVEKIVDRNCEWYEGGEIDAQAIVDELNAVLGSDHHPYEQRITGDGSNWGEIMRDAYDDLMASACESCTPEQMGQLADYIRAELGSGTCELEPLSALDVTLNMLDSIEWGACSECRCAVPMDAKFCNECGKAVER